MKRKRIISAVLVVIIMFTALSAMQYVNAEEVEYIGPSFAQENQLYAQGIEGVASEQSWHKWSEYSGINSQNGVKYFFLPSSASDSEFMVYNSYNSSVTVNGVSISGNALAAVPYKSGNKYKAVCNGNEQTYIVYKSDSDASIYVNDVSGYYEDANGVVYNDFYTFLTASKDNAVKGSAISIVADGSVTETTLKKIKGRGNTTWKYSDKKPFNLNFDTAVNIAGLENKKFSMLSNSKDGSLLRNKVAYDLADSVDQPYSPDTRFIDLFINGTYRGSYLISKKVEMGKSSLVTLKDNSSGVTENFNFLVEIDIWNYQGDTHFTSSRGQEIALNTPELEDYDETDPIQKGQMDFIQSKYTQFENALYSGSMAELEQICDIESLAKTYLINEFVKNCDGGLTSTYYTYNAQEDKFYATPVWDFDSGLGNVDCLRAGASNSTVNTNGWFTKTITNNNTARGYVNTLGQAFNLQGTTSDGKTYSDIVKQLWADKFVPSINRLLGKTDDSIGKLKSIYEYQDSIYEAANINYVMWNIEWAPADASFPNTFVGNVDYLMDWAEKRFNWMSTQYGIITNPNENTKRVYFANTQSWDTVNCYTWLTGDNNPCVWPGYEATYLCNDENGTEIYYCDIPSENKYIIWDNGNRGIQTVDITLDGVNDFFTPSSTGKIINVNKSVWENVQPTTEPSTNPQPTTIEPSTAESNVMYYLAGTGFDGWDSRNYPMNINSDGTATIDFTFKKGVYYHFKVVEYTGDVITNYYQQSTDEVTCRYMQMTGIHNNSDITPDEDIKLTVTLDISQGLFTAKPCEEQLILLGDADGDGDINIMDVTCIQKYLAEIINTDEIDIKCADYDNDGIISIKDATSIQKYIVGIIERI